MNPRNKSPFRKENMFPPIDSSMKGCFCFSSHCIHAGVTACVLFLAISCLSFSFMVCTAQAATWPVSTQGLSTSCSFHQSYSAGAQSYVHSGIDIPASAETQISAPLAGTVRFTGSVPSGDSRTGGATEQRTMEAVSIEVADGKVITLMPFSQINVTEGQYVCEGAPLGWLASSGDVSTPGTHLHMGYKQGTQYMDPMLLFNATSSAAESPQEVSESVVAPAASFGASEQLALQEGADLSSISDPALTTTPAESFSPIETGSYVLKEKLPNPSPFEVFYESTLGALGSACLGQLTAFLEALSSLSHQTGVPLEILVVGICVLALIATVALVVICARVFGQRLHTMWKTGKSRLSEQTGGDSMHKLFPAPGAAFMSRGRIAQRR